MTDSLLVEIDDRGVCTLTLNRLERHNAFDDQLINALLTKLQEIERVSATRVVILTGAGKSFSSGADLEWMRSMAKYDEETNRQDAQRLADLLQTLDNLNKPTIAWVNGSAFGGAVGLIACCDIVVASERAEFALTEVRLGLVPSVISPYVIAAIGRRQARRLFLNAERIGAEEAKRIGLVHQVAKDEELPQAVETQVSMVLKGGPQALTECKQLVGKLAHAREDADTVDLIARLRVSPEGQEGMTAFFEKRKPTWIK
ncbi:MAG: enoyl-CoA hydratase-related protein [Acidiferrobacterales bacterium]